MCSFHILVAGKRASTPAACDGEPGGELPDHAACHLYQQDWGIPFVLDADGESELVLDLRGVN